VSYESLMQTQAVRAGFDLVRPKSLFLLGLIPFMQVHCQKIEKT
jgi:hypothetical protein